MGEYLKYNKQQYPLDWSRTRIIATTDHKHSMFLFQTHKNNAKTNNRERGCIRRRTEREIKRHPIQVTPTWPTAPIAGFKKKKINIKKEREAVFKNNQHRKRGCIQKQSTQRERLYSERERERNWETPDTPSKFLYLILSLSYHTHLTHCTNCRIQKKST